MHTADSRNIALICNLHLAYPEFPWLVNVLLSILCMSRGTLLQRCLWTVGKRMEGFARSACFTYGVKHHQS